LSELRFASKRDLTDDFFLHGIDNGGSGAFSVEGEDPPGLGLVTDGVRICSGWKLDFRFKRGEIEDGHVIAAAVADETAIEFGREGNAMDAICRDGSDGAVGREIDNNDLPGVADEEAMCAGLHRQVIPTAGPLKRDAADEGPTSEGIGSMSRQESEPANEK
jgi:hypothetical protein